MIILGLNYIFHDSTACIVKDGDLAIAIEEERFTRVKHTQSFPVNAIEKCLELTNLNYNDIDYVAVSVKPNDQWPHRLSYMALHPFNLKPFKIHVWNLIRQRDFWGWYNSKWNNQSKRPKVELIPHHLTHVAGSFFISPYREAALLSLDGSGEWATSWLGFGKDNKIRCFNQSYFPMSLGSLYEAVTQFCGFKPLCDEGKTMGLSAFGDASRFQPLVEKIIQIDRKGKIKIDLSYFSFQFSGRQQCSPKFIKAFGEPRDPRAKKGEFEQHHKDTAAAFQRVLEERVLQLCKILKERTGAQFLVFAGGVSLNSVINGRILRESGFEDLYVMPAAGDNGTAIGAAYYLYNKILKKPRTYILSDPYLGTSYTDEQISSILDECKLKAERHNDIAGITAELLFEGNIIGWFQGKMEIGPRALGNRSILANPLLPLMKAKINAEVKHREAFRPFAPATPLDSAKDNFEIDVPTPFMLKVCNVRPDKRNIIPAVTHIDGSARLQTVDPQTNPLFHDLIIRFGRLSDVPVLLNTSFNIMGEPIVESPYHAIRCFFSTGLDYLVLGNYLIKK